MTQEQMKMLEAALLGDETAVAAYLDMREEQGVDRAKIEQRLAGWVPSSRTISVRDMTAEDRDAVRALDLEWYSQRLLTLLRGRVKGDGPTYGLIAYELNAEDPAAPHLGHIIVYQGRTYIRIERLASAAGGCPALLGFAVGRLRGHCRCAFVSLSLLSDEERFFLEINHWKLHDGEDMVYTAPRRR